MEKEIYKNDSCTCRIQLISRRIQTKLKKLGFLVCLFLILGTGGFAATITSNAVTGNWSAPGTWAGGIVPGAGDDVIIANGADITVDGNYTCQSLTYNGGNQDSWVNISAPNSLTVTGVTSITSNSNNDYKAVIVNSGSFNTGTVDMNSNGNNRDAYIEIGTGTVTVTGDITMNATDGRRNYILFSGNGTLNAGGTITGGIITSTGGGSTTNPPTTGVVNYNNAGNQDIGDYTYYNLTISGSGNKSLTGALTVSNDLTMSGGDMLLNGFNASPVNVILTSGNIELGNNTLTMTGTLTGGSASSMVVTNGTGYMIRNASATLPILFPVGTDGLYDPFSITAINNTTGTISLRTTAFSALGPKYVARYWDVLTSVAGNTITATFQYDASEITIAPTVVYYKPGAGAWQTPSGSPGFGANTFSITGTTDITTVNSSWTAGAVGTYYSYQTGNWDNPTTWTSDPGGTTQVGSTVPGDNDAVVILNGRTVSLPADITAASLNVTINSGGIIDMATYQFVAGLASSTSS